MRKMIDKKRMRERKRKSEKGEREKERDTDGQSDGEQRDGTTHAPGMGVSSAFPFSRFGLVCPPTRTTTRVRRSTQLPGRFASVGTSRFFAPRRSRSS